MVPLIKEESKVKARRCHPRFIYKRYRKRDKTMVLKFLSPSLSTANEWMFQVEFKLPLKPTTPEDLIRSGKVKIYGDSPSFQYWGPWYEGTPKTSLYPCPYPPTIRKPIYQLDHHAYAVLKRICDHGYWSLPDVNNPNDFI